MTTKKLPKPTTKPKGPIKRFYQRLEIRLESTELERAHKLAIAEHAPSLSFYIRALLRERADKVLGKG